MKTLGHLCRCIGGASLALALIGMVSASSAFAQEKGAEKLMKLGKTEDLQKVEAGDTVVMSCPKCKDIYVQVVEKTFKGAKPEELKKKPVHLCSTCETKIVTKGVGKQAEDTLVHTCKMCGSEDVSCAVIKKHGAAKK